MLWSHTERSKEIKAKVKGYQIWPYTGKRGMSYRLYQNATKETFRSYCGSFATEEEAWAWAERDKTRFSEGAKSRTN